MQKPNDKDGSEDNKSLFIAKLWKNSIYMAFLLKEWIYFIFNKDPDCISKNLVRCSLHFTTDLFTNNAQIDVGFSERLKLKDDAVPAILDMTVMSQHTSVSNCILLLLNYDVLEVKILIT